jgi:hypothetical protein
LDLLHLPLGLPVGAVAQVLPVPEIQVQALSV